MHHLAVLEEKDFNGVLPALMVDHEQSVLSFFATIQTDAVGLKIHIYIRCQIEGVCTICIQIICIYAAVSRFSRTKSSTVARGYVGDVGCGVDGDVLCSDNTHHRPAGTGKMSVNGFELAGGPHQLHNPTTAQQYNQQQCD